MYVLSIIKASPGTSTALHCVSDEYPNNKSPEMFSLSTTKNVIDVEKFLNCSFNLTEPKILIWLPVAEINLRCLVCLGAFLSNRSNPIEVNFSFEIKLGEHPVSTNNVLSEFSTLILTRGIWSSPMSPTVIVLVFFLVFSCPFLPKKQCETYSVFEFPNISWAIF